MPAPFTEEDQRLGDKRGGTPGLPKRRQIQPLQGGVITRSISVWHAPEDIAFVQVDCDQTSVWRFHDREAYQGARVVHHLEVSSQSGGMADPWQIRFGILGLYEFDDDGELYGGGIHDTGLRIGTASLPIPPTSRTWHFSSSLCLAVEAFVSD